MNITSQRLSKMMDLCYAEVPDFKVKFKDKSFFMKFLNFFVQIFNKRFMTNYTTVIGSTVYFPSEEVLLEHQDDYARTLAHELRHMKDRAALGTVPFFLVYLSPQIFAVLALLALGAFWNLWFLFALLFLGLLAPIPAYGRKVIEMRGYEVSLAVHYWQNAQLPEDYFDHITKQFDSMNYYGMWPFPAAVKHELKVRAVRIRTGEILKDPLFRQIHDVFVFSK